MNKNDERSLFHILHQHMNTWVVNFISGPGAGKSVMSASIFVQLKLAGYNTEYCQEYAKI
jgi:pantothenate kinase-related protein Tda10